MLPVIQVGPLTLQAPGLIILLGIWVGLTVAERHASRYGLSGSLLYNVALLMIAVGLVGARLAFVFRYPQAFIAAPLSVFSVNPDIFDVRSGILIAGLGGYLYAVKKHLPIWSLLDALTPVLAVFMVALGLSHLASGDAFGAPTNLPWALELWGARRHPSQVYETIAALIIMLIILPPKIINSDRRLHGVTFLVYVTLTALSHLFLEAFRGDSQTFLYGLRTTQVIAWFILAISLVFLRKRIPYSTSEINGAQ